MQVEKEVAIDFKIIIKAIQLFIIKKKYRGLLEFEIPVSSIQGELQASAQKNVYYLGSWQIELIDKLIRVSYFQSITYETDVHLILEYYRFCDGYQLLDWYAKYVF